MARSGIACISHAGRVELFTEIWRRASSVQPAPPPALVVLVAAAGFALVTLPSIWPYTRMLVTITHEGSHAAAALLTGRRLHGIRLHSDTSGLTVSSGRPNGPGMIITLIAGYLGPALAGLAAAGLLIAGHGLALLWLVVIILALMLLQIRNVHGFAVVIGCVGGPDRGQLVSPCHGPIDPGLPLNLDPADRSAEASPRADSPAPEGTRTTLRRRSAGPTYPRAGPAVGRLLPGGQLGRLDCRRWACCLAGADPAGAHRWRPRQWLSGPRDSQSATTRKSQAAWP